MVASAHDVARYNNIRFRLNVVTSRKLRCPSVTQIQDLTTFAALLVLRLSEWNSCPLTGRIFVKFKCWGYLLTSFGHVLGIIIYFQLRTATFKAYCAIWVRRFNFRHQASSRVSPSESTQRRKVELWTRNVR
jgi:hypothetical protein